MGTITASLERSLQNCSLNQTTTTRSRKGRGGGVRSSSSSDCPNNPHPHPHQSSVSQSNVSSSDDNSAFVNLNSHLSLPYHWEQCLDLKTGEIYYINWSNGMKAKQDPRTTTAAAALRVGDSYCSEDEGEDEDEENESGIINHNHNDNGYESEGDGVGSSSTYSSTSTRESFPSIHNNNNNKKALMYDDDDDDGDEQGQEELRSDSILVVAGCKRCLMYYMLPKHAQHCPKCCAHLLHFPADH